MTSEAKRITPHLMYLKTKLVFSMMAAAIGVGGMVYLISGNEKLAFAVGGLLLLTDLHFVPKMLPQVFGQHGKNNDRK